MFIQKYLMNLKGTSMNLTADFEFVIEVLGKMHILSIILEKSKKEHTSYNSPAFLENISFSSSDFYSYFGEVGNLETSEFCNCLRIL